jgi:hypothetical protein
MIEKKLLKIAQIGRGLNKKGESISPAMPAPSRPVYAPRIAQPNCNGGRMVYKNQIIISQREKPHVVDHNYS